MAESPLPGERKRAVVAVLIRLLADVNLPSVQAPDDFFK
jgi:hypothetical protein